MPRSTDISPLSVLLSRVDAASDGTPWSDAIASGFASLDTLLGGGFRRSDLVVLGGDVASGKSALALAFAIRAALRGTRVAFLSGEMPVERILERVVAIEARASIDDLRSGKLDERMRANAGAVAVRLRERLPTIELLRVGGGAEQVAELMAGLPSLELIVVDSLASFSGGARRAEEDTAAAIRQLKALAVDRNVAVLATAPLPNLASRSDRRPTLDDFGGLGCVKQQADVVLALFREDMYEPARDIEGATELLVRKNRNGPTGYVDLYFYSQWMRFEDVLDPDQ